MCFNKAIGIGFSEKMTSKLGVERDEAVHHHVPGERCSRKSRKSRQPGHRPDSGGVPGAPEMVGRPAWLEQSGAGQSRTMVRSV